MQVATLTHPWCSLVDGFTFWGLNFTLNSKKTGHTRVYVRGTRRAAVRGAAKSLT